MNPELCKRPNCGGEIEDGYCNICGLAAGKSLSPNLVQQVTGRTSPTASTATLGVTSPSAASSPFTNRSSARSSKGTRRSSPTTSRSSRKQLGAGLVSIPDLPSTDPEKAILAEAVVPENKRFCSSCNQALRRERGFCSKCGQKYSFVPTLKPGDLVMNQYEVKGAIAYGGLGWIYLGFDKTLSRYVVLKGLLNSEDAASAAVAVAERQFLAAMKHANIVGIYNFVNHGGEGFIIMEYVGGQTLKDIRKARGPLPPTEAVAYIHRILSAFSYLHSQGVVYCDFKPDNVMLEGGDVKLIDMGGVRRLDDAYGDIYGTVGYTAPEVSEDGPSIASDLFTVGRTLAVLLTNISGFSKAHQYTLPTPAEEPLFERYDSLYRFLLRSTAYEPGDRFESADEMADQLLGVLREMVAQETGIARPASSSLFGGDLLAMTIGGHFEPIVPRAEQLPPVLLDSADPAFQSLLNAISLPDLSQRSGFLQQLSQQFPTSQEIQLQFVNTLIAMEQYDRAAKQITHLKEKEGWDWRIPWYFGKLHLAMGNGVQAKAAFEEVYAELPGELAPKLAIGFAAELAKDYPLAAKMYNLVSLTDPSYVSAAFGLARCLATRGRRQEAVKALERIPASSSVYLRSQVEKARLLVNHHIAQPAVSDLKQAAIVIEAAALSGFEKHRLVSELFQTALSLVTTKAISPDKSMQLLGHSLEEFKLRVGLEKALRAMAHLETGAEKIRLVDQANQVRPRTWT